MGAVPERAEAAHERGGPGLTEGAPTQASDAASRAGITLERGMAGHWRCDLPGRAHGWASTVPRNIV